MKILRTLLGTILINALAPFLVAYFFPHNFIIEPLWGYAVVGITIGIANALIKPVLSLLALPLVIITFGFFLTIINAFLLYCVEMLYSEIFIIGIDFRIEGGILYYFIAAALLSLLNSIFHFVFGK